MKKLLPILALMFPWTAALAQSEPEMADAMRANGKIYVVLGVILIVLLGLFVYLFFIEKKVKKLEQKIEDNR